MHMRKIIKVSWITALFVTISLVVSCGSQENKNLDSTQIVEVVNVVPVITENGVEPFILGQSILNIPPKGKYYDTILLNRYYGVTMGDHYVEIEESEIDDYYKTMGGDYFEPDAIFGTATVISDGDTLMVVKYDELGVINEIEVYSSKLETSNGIHIGLSSSELFSKYQAVFLTTDGFAGESWQAYHVPGLAENITLYAYRNDTERCEWYWNVIGFPEPDRTIFKCVKEDNDGHSPLFSVPLKYVENKSIEKISIVKGGDEGFHI